VNYKYPLVPEDRCRNALARWSAFREEYEQSERNIIYERIVRCALQYGITVNYDLQLPEARTLPADVKGKLEGFEATDSIIARVEALIAQLSVA